MTVTAMQGRTYPPSNDLDLFSDTALEHPYGAFTQLRMQGSVVWLSRYQVYALTGHGVIRQALLDHKTFSSVHGVSLNGELNEYQRGTMPASDPFLHTKLRALIADAFTPAFIRKSEADIEDAADVLVANAVRRGSFDVMEDIAMVLPTEVISDIIGLPEAGRKRLLSLGHYHFDSFAPGMNDPGGPPPPRAVNSWKKMQTASATIGFMCRRLSPGSLGERIFAAAARGEINEQQAFKLVSTLIGAGADTTARTIGNAFHCFAEHPEQWELLRAEPGRINSAINEVMRYDSPSQMLTRYVTRDTELGGEIIPAGSRALVLFASGNRDEQAFPNADQFDITRDPLPGHLSFSAGIHTCIGQALARVEVRSVLKALMRHVRHITLDGAPVRRINSVLRGYERLPVRVAAQQLQEVLA